MDQTQLALGNTYSGFGLVMAYLAMGLWLSATAGAWILGIRAIVAAIVDRRRLVGALRWGTLASSLDLIGLIVMTTVANPVRWRTMGWLISLIPLALTMLAILLASRPSSELSPTDSDAA